MLLKPGFERDRDPTELGLNAVILILDWLFLGQPSAPSRGLHLGLGEPLTEAQLGAVKSLRMGVEDWNSAGPFARGAWA